MVILKKSVKFIFLPLIFFLFLMFAFVKTPVSVLANEIPDLFFSEYIEGSSYNKALEIYNPTSTDIDLSVYTLEEYMNGAITPNFTINLPTFNLTAGNVYIICHGSFVDPPRSIECDTISGSIQFNGDDATVLKNNGVIIDSIGKIGEDPSAGYWGSEPVTTLDHTLTRKCEITHGDANPSDSFDPAVEWDGHETNDFTYLGSHNYCPAICGNNVIETGEQCDGGDCCSSDCTFKPAQTECRTIASLCDIAETCTGSSADCLGDGYLPVGTACSDGNLCNGDETCSDLGTCISGTPPTCDPYTCNIDSGCKTSCDGNADCQPGYLCNPAGQCVASVGSISGFVYFDADKDNIWDGWKKWEFRMNGWMIFIDQNNNKKYDKDEKHAITKGYSIFPLGIYSFREILAGSYNICELKLILWKSTLPGGTSCQQVDLLGGENKKDINFGNSF